MSEVRQIIVEGSPRIALNVTGQGPLLLLMHGIGGNSANWDLQLPAFAPFFTVAAWDARGYGDSEDYEGELDFGDFSADLLRVLNHFGAKSAHLCGLSMGGRIAQDFYARHPGRVASMVLCDTFAGDDESDSRSGRSQSVEDFVQSRIQPYLDGADPKERAYQVAGRLMGPNPTDDAVERAARAHARLHVESYIKTVRASATYNRVNNLPNIKVPVLLVFGRLDPLTPPHVGEYMHERISGSELVIIEDAGHMTNLEQPQMFNAAVLEFLRRQI